MPRWPSSSPPAAESRPGLGPGWLPADAGHVLLPLARAAIAEELGLLLVADASPEWLHRPGACFVTLTRAGALRGCIGTLTAHRSLGEDVRANACAAAFGDPRFWPLTRAELDDTAVEVAVLSPRTPLSFTTEADALAQLRPGIDGVVLECAGRRATFLPQVWGKLRDPREFLAHLKVKAGFAPDFWCDDLGLDRYTVIEFHEGEET